jgi:redox-sensitive bicupin YhaK (pirin superfamily)
MITLRRADERHHERRQRHEVWFTFPPRGGPDLFAGGFGALESIDEERLAPGAGAPRRAGRDSEIVTYVSEGALAHEDSMGRSGVIRAGEFHRRTGAKGLRHTETNASRNDWVHTVQLWLSASEDGQGTGTEPGHEQRRFSAAERRGRLCVVASPDGRRGSLRIRQDALMCSAMLDPGQHVVHELAPGRSAWLHLLRGEVTLGDQVLLAGDGAGLTGERAVSFTARVETEILLLDLAGAGAARPARDRGVS